MPSDLLVSIFTKFSGKKSWLTDEGAKVCNGCSTILENAQADHWFVSFSCDPFLVDDEDDKADAADDERHESAPVIPRIHNTAPCDRNEEPCCSCDEEDHADPVNASKLLCKGASLVVQSKEEDDQGNSQANKWKINPAMLSVTFWQVPRPVTNQKIQVQSTFSANPPPSSGPTTVPRAHMELMKLNHLPRSRRGTRSVTTISVSAITPPPPMPWMDLPTRMTPKLFATAAMMAPTPKKVKLMKMIGFRPKMELKFPSTGWKTVVVRRKAVPAQNASIAVPPSSFAMMGRATERDVASRAAMSVTTQRETKAA